MAADDGGVAVHLSLGYQDERWIGPSAEITSMGSERQWLLRQRRWVVDDNSYATTMTSIIWDWGFWVFFCRNVDLGFWGRFCKWNMNLNVFGFTCGQLNLYTSKVSFLLAAIVRWLLVKNGFHSRRGTRQQKVCIVTGLWLLVVLPAASENPYFTVSLAILWELRECLLWVLLSLP